MSPSGSGRALHHHHTQAELARRGDLGVGRAAAGVLAHHDIDAAGAKQLALGGKLERSALEEHLALRRQAIRGRRLNGAYEIDVLRRCLERRHLLSADAQKHPRRLLAKRRCRLPHIADARPVVAILLAPGRSLQEQQRQSELGCGGGSVGRDARGKRVRSVHDGIDAFGAEPIGKTLGAAEAADPMGDRRQHRLCRTAGERENGRKPCVIGQAHRQLECLYSASKYENPHGTR